MPSQKRFRPYDPHAPIPVPTDLRDWLPEDHLVYFVSDLIDDEDLSAFYEPYERDELRGQPPYEPRMMVKLVVYAYIVGIPSSRRIECKTYEDLAFRVLTCDQHPDHDTISGFRKQHLGALSALFVQVLAVCQQAELTKLGHVALDGTKIKANASKHKAMSYGRMDEKEKELEAEVRELIRRAEQEDDKEDSRYGKDKRGHELPDELRFRQGRLDMIRKAKRELEAQAWDQAIADGKLNPDGTPKSRPGPKPKTPPGQPKPHAQRNFTDPESRIMKNGDKAFVQGWNCQAAVDSDSQVIVAADVTPEANDKQQIKPMAAQVKANTGRDPKESNLRAKLLFLRPRIGGSWPISDTTVTDLGLKLALMGRDPKEWSADSGYFSEDNVKHLEGKGIDVYISPCREKHGPSESDAVVDPGADLCVADRMRQKLQSDRGKVKYSKRKETVEPVFGQTKQVRGLGQFLLRGLEQVRGEWRLWCLGHNILKLWRSGWRPQVATG